MDEANKKLSEMRNHWEKRIPGLSGKYTHWWLEGYGGVLLVTDNLSELIDKINKYYCRSLKLSVSPAYHDESGDCIKGKSDTVISEYKNDRINNRFDY